jgi:endonuclease-8
MEGPSVVKAVQELKQFEGLCIKSVEGSTLLLDKKHLENQCIRTIRSWGRHLLIQFDACTLRVHFLLFGSYTIDQLRHTGNPQLALICDDKKLYFYHCSLAIVTQDVDSLYDWRIDIMSSSWDCKLVAELLSTRPHQLVCDALVDQDIFAGIGNSMKNEILFMQRLHPLVKISQLNKKQLIELIAHARSYALDFYQWSKKMTVRKNLQVYQKRLCPRCMVILKKETLGQSKLATFFCDKCQLLAT